MRKGKATAVAIALVFTGATALAQMTKREYQILQQYRTGVSVGCGCCPNCKVVRQTGPLIQPATPKETPKETTTTKPNKKTKPARKATQPVRQP